MGEKLIIMLGQVSETVTLYQVVFLHVQTSGTCNSLF